MKKVLHSFNNEENKPEWKKSEYCSQHDSGIKCRICKLEWLHEVVMNIRSYLKKYASVVLTCLKQNVLTILFPGGLERLNLDIISLRFFLLVIKQKYKKLPNRKWFRDTNRSDKTMIGINISILIPSIKQVVFIIFPVKLTCVFWLGNLTLLSWFILYFSDGMTLWETFFRQNFGRKSPFHGS